MKIKSITIGLNKEEGRLLVLSTLSVTNRVMYMHHLEQTENTQPLNSNIALIRHSSVVKHCRGRVQPVVNNIYVDNRIESPVGYTPTIYTHISPPNPSAVGYLKESIRSDILQKLNHSTNYSTSNILSPSKQPSVMSNQRFYHQSNSHLGKRGKYAGKNDLTSTSSKKAKVYRNEKSDLTVAMKIPCAIEHNTLEQVSNSIWNYFLRNQQSEEVYQKKILLRKCLYAVLQGVFPYCGLYIVGSSMNGFGNTQSDMDLCLMVSNKKIDQRREAIDILFNIHRALRQCSFISSACVIKAKVPILKFKDMISTVDCDLNINNSVGIRNTHLLKYYASMDKRIRPLMLFIKYWARYHNINDASKATLSSYSLGLMLIHYLQDGCWPPVLPALHKIHPEMFSSSSDIRQLKLNENLKFESNNNESVGQLFLGFLDYYSNKFDFDNFGISVRLGTKRPRREMTHQTDNIRQWKYLCVEEPFDLSNTARAVFDEYAFIRIRRVFRVSYIKLSQKRDVNAILSQPF